MSISYKDALQQQIQLNNQPNPIDAQAEVFARMGAQPGVGPAQQVSNAITAGIGAGMKGYSSRQKQENLNSYFEQAGQITAMAAELEAQMQLTEKYKLSVDDFAKTNTPLIAEFASAVDSNDPRASLMFKNLIGKAAGKIPGFENLEGESWNASGGYGLALNKETGEYRKITADDIIGVIAPTAQAMYGDTWFEKFIPLNGGFAKNAEYNFNINREANQEKLQNLKLQNQDLKSNTNYKNLQSQTFIAQASEPKPKYNEKVLSKIIETNHNWVNNLDQEQKKLELEREAYSKIANLITIEKDKFGGRAGSGLIALANRAINKSGTESEKNQALIELYKQPLMAGIKQIFAGATSDKDIAVFIAGLPSLDKNPAAAIQIAQERAAKLDKLIQKNNVTLDVVENDFGYSEPYNSLAVQNLVKSKMSQGSMPQINQQNQNVSDEIGFIED